MRTLLSAGLALFLLSASAQTVPSASPDSDRDGLSDAVEDALLSQFAPRFMVSGTDCSVRPAQFVSHLSEPQIQTENGTIYGQAFPRDANSGQVELHYYHLWRKDCGELGHRLDAEHVAALVVRGDDAKWRARYWYAAAHEDTVCDASQVARAVTVDGELRGPAVWVSDGKHASFLNPAICSRGCGGDHCRATEPLVIAGVVNLGEPSHAMNGATWADSAQWPLARKMRRSDFPDSRTVRVDHLPVTSIAWANPEGRPMEAAISGGNGALAGVATGLQAADTALDVANSNTENALSNASGNTGSALAKSARKVKRALRTTARKLGRVH